MNSKTTKPGNTIFPLDKEKYANNGQLLKAVPKQERPIQPLPAKRG